MITYLEAIREAQYKALSDDPRVYIYGQDVGVFGGAFKATKGLAKEFPGRVLDSPLSEDAMVGSAIGASLLTLPTSAPQFRSREAQDRSLPEARERARRPESFRCRQVRRCP